MNTPFHTETLEYFKGKRVAVTGGSGFIGSRLVEFLVDMGAQVVVPTRQSNPAFLKSVQSKINIVPCDLTDLDQTLEAFSGCTVVLSLAAKVAGLEFNAKHPASIFQDNLEMFFTTIKAAQKLGVERFLTTSSACVYPRHCRIPTPEEDGFVDEPEITNSGYGWSKRMEEYLSRQYAQEFGMSVAIARPYNAYGPRDNFDPQSSHVIPSLIRKAFETTTDTFKVWGDGSHSRSFLYVDDFARGLLEVAARYPQADPVNIGADEETTIRDIAIKIGELVSVHRGSRVAPAFDPKGLTGQPRRKCDVTKAKTLLQYEAHTSLEHGLKQTVAWFAAERSRL